MNRIIPTRLTYIKKRKAVLENCNNARVEGNTVLIKSLFSAISRGTERLVYNGQVPTSVHETMKCPHQVGNFSFPISYGYACIGEVMDMGEDVTSHQIGDRIFVLHPHQNSFCIDAEAANIVPRNIPTKRATLTANLETALNAIWDAQLDQNSKVTVIGAGIVGLLVAFLARLHTSQLPIIIDIDESKREIANKLGLEFINVKDTDFSKLSLQTHIFHASTTQHGLQAAMNIAGFEAKIIEMSWYGNKKITLNLGDDFHAKRLQIISSQVGAISPAKREIITQKQRVKSAMAFLENPVLDVLLEEPIAFEDLPNHLEGVFNQKNPGLCQLIKYN